MTEHDALEEARRRWGFMAHVRWNGSLICYDVGYEMGGRLGKYAALSFISKGQGDTWETAFDDADRRTWS